jgi:GNAT superfamily N-acetyltransferase
MVNHTSVRVSYLELTQAPAPIPANPGQERVSREKMAVAEYLDLYRRVGEPLRWDQRLKMPVAELRRLLRSADSQVYVLKGASGQALGFCEFERSDLQEVELKNFGLVPAAYGRGLGPWLLLTALHQEWALHPRRIWLHTDNWDHPAALHVYQSAGFRAYMVRDQPPADL